MLSWHFKPNCWPALWPLRIQSNRSLGYLVPLQVFLILEFRGLYHSLVEYALIPSGGCVLFFTGRTADTFWNKLEQSCLLLKCSLRLHVHPCNFPANKLEYIFQLFSYAVIFHFQFSLMLVDQGRTRDYFCAIHFAKEFSLTLSANIQRGDKWPVLWHII